jgi:stearoyl-CoA desaturase (delta-9 desaturase)
MAPPPPPPATLAPEAPVQKPTVSDVIAEAAPEDITPQADPAKLKRQEEAQQIIDSFSSKRLRWNNVDWVVTGYLATVHLGCIAAPFFVSWQAVAVCLVLHWFTCSIGICLGYHRYLSHKSMKLKKPAEFCVLAAGAISAEGSPLTWAATHRLHHQKSDQEGDPHSPHRDSTFWSHIAWLFPQRSNEDRQLLFKRYIPELASNKMLQFFERTYPMWLWASALVLLGLGYLVGGGYSAVAFLVWGVCVRTTFAYHSTWFVNSATHLWGYRNYKTRDESKNLWWVAILAYGEGWHNNHHAHPSVAPAGHKWWEVDITWWAIKALRVTGLAYDVKTKVPAQPEG